MASYSEEVLKDHPIFYLPMRGSDDGKLPPDHISDASGNALDAVLQVNATPVTIVQSGSAYYADAPVPIAGNPAYVTLYSTAANAFLSLPTIRPAAFPTGVTFECWKYGTYEWNNSVFVGLYDNVGGSNLYFGMVGYTGTTGTFRLAYGINGGQTNQWGIDMSLVTGWHHWAITFPNGGLAEVFLDGVSQGQTGFSAWGTGFDQYSFEVYTSYGYIGPNASTQHAVYPYILTADRIVAHYRARGNRSRSFTPNTRTKRLARRLGAWAPYTFGPVGASAATAITAAVSANAGNAGVSSNGSEQFAGSVAASAANGTAASSATERYSAAIMAGSSSASASVAASEQYSGSVAANASNAGASGTATETITSSIGATASGATVSSVGFEQYASSVAASAGNAGSSASGSETYTSAVSATAANGSAASGSTETFSSTIAAVAASAGISATAAETYTASVAAPSSNASTSIAQNNTIAASVSANAGNALTASASALSVYADVAAAAAGASVAAGGAETVSTAVAASSGSATASSVAASVLNIVAAVSAVAGAARVSAAGGFPTQPVLPGGVRSSLSPVWTARTQLAYLYNVHTTLEAQNA